MPMRSISKIVTKSLFGEPATLMYPHRARAFVAGARGRIAIEIDKCIFCGLCRKKCPTAALLVNKEKRSWEIDRLKCITCNACVEACPKKCLLMKARYAAAMTGHATETFKQETPHAPKPAAVSVPKPAAIPVPPPPAGA